MERISDHTKSIDEVADNFIGNCHKHPHALATERCPECRAPICEYCLTPLGDTFLCKDCARPRRLRKRILMGTLVVAILGVIGVVIWLAAGAVKGADTGKIAKGQNVGRLTDEQAVGLELAKDPCNRKYAKAWVTEHAYDDCDKVLSRAQHYFDRCGPYPRLRWTTFGCYKRRKQYAHALVEVNRLIAQYPNDKDFRWWRGELHAHNKFWRKSLNDYWQAIILSPAMRLVPFDLVLQAQRAKQKCQAVFPMLQHAFYYKDHKLSVEDQNTRLKAMQACPWTLGKGEVSGPTAAGTNAPPLPVRINGKTTGAFALNLETELTLLSRDFANRLGLGQGKPFLAWYGNQLLSGHFMILGEIAWGQARAQNVEALILKSPPFFTDGVLGRTFLLRFDDRYNQNRTEITLSPRTFPDPTPVPPPDPELDADLDD
jgi:hypothetical protein